mmetsp:Transcript_45696/g.146669  ORF Transcript_45696/g.146669 Transcript_45696/m.146669 type:complete len:268 (-) Transcript_45696:84-887(-)
MPFQMLPVPHTVGRFCESIRSNNKHGDVVVHGLTAPGKLVGDPRRMRMPRLQHHLQPPAGDPQHPHEHLGARARPECPTGYVVAVLGDVQPQGPVLLRVGLRVTVNVGYQQHLLRESSAGKCAPQILGLYIQLHGQPSELQDDHVPEDIRLPTGGHPLQQRRPFREVPLDESMRLRGGPSRQVPARIQVAPTPECVENLLRQLLDATGVDHNVDVRHGRGTRQKGAGDLRTVGGATWSQADRTYGTVIVSVAADGEERVPNAKHRCY